MGIHELPEGFSLIREIDMQKDKKLAVLLNVLALLIGAVVLIIGVLIVPLSITINLQFLILLLLAMVVYMVGHEFVHGIFFKKFSGKKAHFGFTGLYAYAGSDAYFTKKQYIIIGLAPIVVFGILFLILNILLPVRFFWFVYLLQGMNLSGAAGDLYVAILMKRLPADTLTFDSGIAMQFYSKTK